MPRISINADAVETTNAEPWAHPWHLGGPGKSIYNKAGGPCLQKTFKTLTMEAVPPLSLPALATISLLGLVIIYSRSLAAWNARSRGRPLPPGPKLLPFIGNVLDFPTTRQASAFRDMSAQYGEHDTGSSRPMRVLIVLLLQATSCTSNCLASTCLF